MLELLVQNGADLNAKNKHDETPADICEDPEIRERIMELRTEQESKRLRDAQNRRVRRSQSINTRTQSVRRTSIRDKVLTTKKDAQEEARLRLQAQHVNVNISVQFKFLVMLKVCFQFLARILKSTGQSNTNGK